MADVWRRAPIEHPVAYARATLARTYISAQRRRSSHERPIEQLPETVQPDGRGGDPATRLALRAALDGLRAVLGPSLRDLLET